jgi:malate synthase
MPLASGIEIVGESGPRFEEILTPDALDLVATLHRELEGRRRELLAARAAVQDELAAGGTLDFLAETKAIREDTEWRVPEPAPGLVDRRVEITGPTERKMTVNALNSGARVWLADFEDANTPHWENMVGGQLVLADALARRIDFDSPEGKHYRLGPADELATIVVRPRGWHLPEKHLLVDGEPVSASLFDFGLAFAHHAEALLAAGRGPYFYLPKMEHHLEARLWNDAFLLAEARAGLPVGTIRATVLIETLPAAFQMEEILHELRAHSAGLNAGRWDYLFSVIKKFRDRGRDFLLPDRNAVTMTAPFMRAYTELLVRTCHRRGAHAIGGMAAFIPDRRDAQRNAQALAKVRQDKEREAGDGFDGSWVAHPDLVPVCREVFDRVLGDRPHQLHRTREDVTVTAAELLAVGATPGEVTETGLRGDISVGIQYLASWLRGNGAVAVNSLMEDTATAEIARAQVWQWVRHEVMLAGGQRVTGELAERAVAEELAALRAALGADDYAAARYDDARVLFTEVALAEEFVEFLTLPAYARMP